MIPRRLLVVVCCLRRKKAGAFASGLRCDFPSHAIRHVGGAELGCSRDFGSVPRPAKAGLTQHGRESLAASVPIFGGMGCFDYSAFALRAHAAALRMTTVYAMHRSFAAPQGDSGRENERSNLRARRRIVCLTHLQAVEHPFVGRAELIEIAVRGNEHDV